jgi:hypothetical protein
MQPITVNLGWILKLAAFLAFAAAFCVAESWLTVGTWQQWIAGGLGLFTLAELV